jgi:hypothetical protein
MIKDSDRRLLEHRIDDARNHIETILEELIHDLLNPQLPLVF